MIRILESTRISYDHLFHILFVEIEYGGGKNRCRMHWFYILSEYVRIACRLAVGTRNADFAPEMRE